MIPDSYNMSKCKCVFVGNIAKNRKGDQPCTLPRVIEN